MDLSALEKRLEELLNEINEPPANKDKKILSLACQTKLSEQKLKDNLAALHQSLDHLRLTIKYIMFDLEATRRENKYLRKILEGTEE
ncbi:MAG: hypothetical protein A2173_02540 [Planctomycetes bacterium RBG_13_44_8b]|nr:MAG: hypothetical protein A2173_02540 [Planctomycetes bacterium RBG_13_44_8b]